MLETEARTIEPKRKSDYFALLFIGIVAFLVGTSFNAWAKPNTHAKAKRAAVQAAPKMRIANAQAYLQGSVWRASACDKSLGFQAFYFNAPAKVEVGNGKLGDGEKLDILSTARAPNIVEVRTRVCAPIGCNQTFEQYKILSHNQMQEWRFEGLLPNEAPNVVVKDGIASDGSAGRIFNRCAA